MRHPVYVGTFGFELGTGLVLASWPAVLAGAPGWALLVVRTRLEDQTLYEELEGYAAYVTRVRYRLLAGLW